MRIILLSLALFIQSQSCLAQLWDSLGHGLNNSPRTMMVDSITNKLYVGGQFVLADSMPVWGMATWNGSQWDSLAHGIDQYTPGPSQPGPIRTITRYGSYIYVGGAFQDAGNVPSTRAFARWDGAQWSSVPGAVMTNGNTIAHTVVHNGELYVAGGFDSIGNLSAYCLAKWDGATWQTIGNNYDFRQVGGLIDKIIFYNNNLYVAGNFRDPQNNICRLAKWDGATWQFMTSEVAGSFATIWDLEVYNNELYVAGWFYASDGNAGTGIMRWDDFQWRNVAGSVQVLSNPNPIVKDMCVSNGELYCVGNFEKIGGVPAEGLAKWNGNAWCGFGTQFLTFNQMMIGATLIEFYDDTMYVGGGMWYADTLKANCIVKWIAGGYTDSCGVLSNVELVHVSQSVQVYPNPASEVIFFRLDHKDNRTIVVYDQLGREIWRKETSETTVEFPASEHSPAMYFYRIEQAGEIISSGKLLIQ